MDLLDLFLTSEDPAQKNKIKGQVLKEVSKSCFILKDTDTKIDFIKGEIKSKNEELKVLATKKADNEDFVISVAKHLGISPASTIKLSTKEVEVSCRNYPALKLDTSFNNENFATYEATVHFNTKEDEVKLKAFLAENSMTLKEVSPKFDAVAIKKYLKTWVLKGAAIVDNYKLSYKIK